MNARGSRSRCVAWSGVSWIVAYLVLVGFPILVLVMGTAPEGLGRVWDLSMGLGFAGMGVMLGQFGLTARFRRVAAPFGMDIIYYFHRWIAFGGLALLTLHWALLRVSAPEALRPALPTDAPGYMSAGRGALLLFVLIVVSSAWRKRLGLEYDRWRILHGVLAVLAVLLAVWHIAGAGYYTAAPGTRALLAGFATSWLALLLWVRVGKPWHLHRRPWRVTAVEPAADRTWSLSLRPEGHEGIRFQPGQFAWLSLERSPYRAREHPFSISNAADDDPVLEFTVKELGDFTRTIGRTAIGAVAWVDGPHGAFSVDRHADAPAYGFVAGGVGMAPIMSMLRTLGDRRDTRPLRLLYANDGWRDILYREELAELPTRLDLTTTLVLRSPPEEWAGETGLPTVDLVRRWCAGAPDGTEYFLCGPKPMSDLAEDGLRRSGVPISRIHRELFDMA